MCGIVGYLGPQKAVPILLDGLKRLEYRGYDSAGLTVGNTKFQTIKTAGRVTDLEKLISAKGGKEDLSGNYGIAHTRWATHGKPNQTNAHPHFDCNQEIFLVHNGIIENYQRLKERLIAEDHQFHSETDTEVLPHLIEKFQSNGQSLEEAVISTLNLVTGTYGLAIISKKDPQKIVVARNSSPIMIGLGAGEYFVASDASPILPYTKETIYLEDKELAVITEDELKFMDINHHQISKKAQTLDWDVDDIQKDGYDHFMLKEIFEQPQAVKDSIRGRIDQKNWQVVLGGLESVQDQLKSTQKIIITACGTAYLAGLIGKYMVEEYLSLPALVDYASEFRYRQPVLDRATFLCVSQSGETADTLAALKQVKKSGNLTLGLVNVVGSTIARETDAGVYNHIGPEIGVASTKAFTSQITLLTLITLFIGQLTDKINQQTRRKILKAIVELPEQIETILDQNEKIKNLAQKYHQVDNFLFIGRKYNYPIALEGALKLKEISYIHAEGYSAGEMKHGPIALIDEQFPTFGVIPTSPIYKKTYSNLEEIKARSGPLLAVATKGNKKIKKLTKDVIYVPQTLDLLTPVLTVVPLQLFAYHTAALRGCDIDKPRNLAKSVTVE